MKLNGIGVTIPACDWRPLLSPSYRLEYLSPELARPGETYIRGFGLCDLRKKPRMSWRSPTDLKYFHCSRAIQLPTNLPTGDPVTAQVGRIYLDDRALVRFEFAIFRNPHKCKSTVLHCNQAALAFWKQEVVIRIDRSKTDKVALWRAVELLVKYFERMTRKEDYTEDLVDTLEPQLVVLAEVALNEMPRHAQPIDSDAKLWIGYELLDVPGRNLPIDAFYLLNLPGYFQYPFGEEFDRHTMLRAHIGAIHGDLQILTHLLSRCKPCDFARDDVTSYLSDLARSLKLLPSQSDLDYQIVFGLLSVLHNLHGNRLKVLTHTVNKQRLLAPALKADIHSALSLDSDRRRPRSHSSALSINERLRQALNLFAAALTGDPPAGLRYQDTDFRTSASKKAAGVFRRLPDPGRSRLVLVSVGGADGLSYLN